MGYNNIMNFLRKNIGKFVIILFLVVTPILLLYADYSPPAGCPAGKICNPIPSITSLTGLLKTILTAVIKIGIPLVVLAIIYSGFLFVTAVGNAEKLSKAKDALVWSLVGAGVLLGSWAIAELITATVSQLST